MQQILSDARLHRLMHKVVDTLLSCTTQDQNDVSRPYLRFDKERASFVDATSSRFEPGIKFINGRPHELRMPWGYWQCFDTDRSGHNISIYGQRNVLDSYLWMQLWPELIKRFGLEADYYEYDQDTGKQELEYVSFNISKLDDEALPLYDYSEAFDDTDEPERCQMMDDSWEKLEAEYQA